MTGKNTARICVVRVDGGICSQLLFVAYGMAIGASDETVKYDLSWFKEWGRDNQGNQVRNWDVFKLLPDLKIDIASDEEIRLARNGRKGYRYISGYPDRDPAFLKYADLFKSLMKPDLDSSATRLLEQIRGSQSCAIHVRRGDLVNGDPGYGEATSVDYFKRAIDFERARSAGKAVFYVFTDDVSWTQKNVMPLLGGGGVLCQNGADKGYVDLFLMSHCDAIISSIGSLGVFSAVLSDKNPVLYLSHAKGLARGVENAVYFNDCDASASRTVTAQYRKTGLFKLPYKLFRYLEKELRIKESI